MYVGYGWMHIRTYICISRMYGCMCIYAFLRTYVCVEEICIRTMTEQNMQNAQIPIVVETFVYIIPIITSC